MRNKISSLNGGEIDLHVWGNEIFIEKYLPLPEGTTHTKISFDGAISDDGSMVEVDGRLQAEEVAAILQYIEKMYEEEDKASLAFENAKKQREAIRLAQTEIVATADGQSGQLLLTLKSSGGKLRIKWVGTPEKGRYEFPAGACRKNRAGHREIFFQPCAVKVNGEPVTVGGWVDIELVPLPVLEGWRKLAQEAKAEYQAKVAAEAEKTRLEYIQAAEKAAAEQKAKDELAAKLVADFFAGLKRTKKKAARQAAKQLLTQPATPKPAKEEEELHSFQELEQKLKEKA
ncbi:MAG: hypothetical protein HY602_01020 [Parcubacteria group bacterium]|nr:hypothetical protein [Parcubacteria group bacterium]